MSEKKYTAEAIQAFIGAVKFNEQGWVCAVTQDAETGQVVQQAWMDRVAIEKTFETGKAHYYSRSRKKLWMKGETSGNIQELRDIRIDCDGDTVLLLVKQNGAACHEGYFSCFFRKLESDGLEIDAERVFDPKEVYKT
jgi:phosphoribosyl-AMP cyclohydrolase